LPRERGFEGGMFLVTGGAGFIGSNVVANLNEAGINEVIVNDRLGHDDAKWRNLAKRQIADVVPPTELDKWLDRRKLEYVIHMGAISDTTVTDAELVTENNLRLSVRLLDWCTMTRTPYIYASSAATYGDGAQGFDDNWSPDNLRKLKPMNLYGWSKHQFDLIVAERVAKKDKLPSHWAGLKFFNVFGPNEYHKGHMQSVLAKVFDAAKDGEPVSLFKSHREGIADGEQCRDFIYVDDAVAVLRWLMDATSVNGIFNVGTGKAESFRDMITAMFKALGRPPDIDYVDMPEAIRRQYQYFTQARVENLRRAGYNADFTPLEKAVARYVTGYLDTNDRYH
jgi:ADP-L-glycero-D-manno-heptose 6-epimerase